MRREQNQAQRGLEMEFNIRTINYQAHIRPMVSIPKNCVWPGRGREDFSKNLLSLKLTRKVNNKDVLTYN